MAGLLGALSGGCHRREAPSGAAAPGVGRSTLNASPKVGDFVVEAQNSIRLQTGGVVVSGGDLGARGTGTGPFLSGGVSIDLLTGVQVQTSHNVIADSVRLGTGDSTGDIQTNRFVNGTGTTHGGVTALVPLPSLPAVAAVTVGTTALTVATGATVSAAPGRFAAVSVGTGGHLRLTAGLYEMSSLTLGSSARIEALGTVQIHVAGRFTSSSGAFVGAASGVTLTAAGIRIEVSGINGTTGTLTATPPAAGFGTGNTVTALMLVPNGTLSFGTGAVAKGAFLGRDVDIGGSGAQFTFQDGFPNPCTVAACDDGNPCTNDGCGASGGCTHTVSAGTSCSDGNACNGDEICNAAGACVAGTPVVCSARDACHDVGTCAPATGVCSNPVKAAGASCSDGNACNGAETCNAAGSCVAGTPVVCAAPDACHAPGTCAPATGICSNPAKPAGTSCSDGNACNGAETCNAGGSCVAGTAVVCVAQDVCHDPGVCEPTTGACSNPAKPAGTSCGDGNACNGAETCSATGTCVSGTPVVCSAPDQCHLAGACNPITGACTNPLAANGTSCSDGNSCTSGDACQAGSCVGGPSSCGTLAVSNTSGNFSYAFAQLPINLTTDPADVAPGDHLHVTATVTNDGISLQFSGNVGVTNNGTTTATLGGYEETIEYLPANQSTWVPVARVAYDATGAQIPPATALPQPFLSSFINDFSAPGVTYSFFPPITGTAIEPGATGSWGYVSFVSLPPETETIVLDPQQSTAVRAVIRFDPIGSGTTRDEGPLDLSSTVASLPPPVVDSTIATASLDQGTPVTLTTTSTGAVAPGTSVVFTGELSTPSVQARDQFPDDGSYIAYLTTLSTTQHSIEVDLTGDTLAGSDSVMAAGAVPVIKVAASGPPDIVAGQSVEYTLALRNDGTGMAGPFVVSDSVDGAPLATSPSTPPQIAPAQTANATVDFVVPSDRPAGAFADQIAVTWSDRNQNVYGPVTGSYAPNLHVHGQGSLLVSQVVTQIVGAEATMTVTALDSLDQPVASIPVHVVITGPNAQVLDVITGADGHADVVYTGIQIGTDTLVATATLTTTPVSSAPMPVVWAGAVGTPCTGRANPLDVVLVIDGSPSMLNGNNVAAAQAATNRFIDDLDFTRDQVAAVLFSGDAQLATPLTTDPVSAKSQIDDALQAYAHACDSFCAGGSNFAAALDVALSEIQGSRRRSTATPLVVFLSDGGNTGPDFTSEVTQLAGNGVRVITLGLGADVDNLLLRQLASTPNDYFYAPSAAGLAWIYDGVTQDVCRNRPPLVSAGGSQGVYEIRLPDFLTLNGEVHDDGLAGDTRLTTEWTVVSGPGPVSFTDPSSAVTKALFTLPGTYVLRLQATDGFLTVADRTTVTVDPDPSIAGANLAIGLGAPGPLVTGNSETVVATFTYAGMGTPVGSYPVRLTVSGANATTATAITNNAGVATFSYVGTRAGTDTIHVTAIASALQVDSASLTLTWTEAPGEGPLLTQGWLGGPAHQSSVTGQVPVTLSPDITLTSGTVTYWPASSPDQVHTLATGVSGSPGATVATLDGTVLANGSYIVKLDGIDSTNQHRVSQVLVTVTGDYKPGRVVVEVTDFKLPIAGLPITVGRRYDSLERDNVGDFGHGWSLALGHPRLDVDPAHNVTITMPDGRRVTFYFQPTFPQAGPVVLGFLLQPAYVPEPGVFGKLTADGCQLLSFDPTAAIPTPICLENLLDPGNLDYAPTTYTYTDAYGRQFVMAANGELKSITDHQGNTLTFGPDGIVSSAGPAVTFQRDAQRRITKVVSPDFGAPAQHFESNYTYDGAGDLVQVDLPPGEEPVATTHHTYDPGHLLQATVDPRGNAARTSTYDAEGRLSEDKDALGNITRYAYDVGARTTRITDPDTGVVVQTFDDRGLLLSETDPLGRTTTHEYDGNRNEIARTNALGERTTSTYDANGNPTSVTDSRGRTTQATYDELANPASFTDALGQVTTVQYDDRGVPQRIADSMGTRFTFTSSQQGLPITIDDAAGKRAYLNYDAAGDVTSRTDWLGRVTKASFDGIGRKVTETSARGAVRTNNYNPRGTLASFTDSLTGIFGWHRFTYDANENMVADYLPFAGRSTNYAYDALNHLTGTSYGDGSSVSYARDFRGNKLTETDEGGHTTTYEYDLAGQLLKTTYADGTFTTRGYDVLGRLVSSSDERGNATTYEYDPGCGCADRVTKVTDPLGRSTATAYDAAGRRTSVTDPAGHQTSYSYDARGHVLETSYADGTSVHDGYDDRGRRTSTTDQLGTVTAFGYDDQGQLTSVTDGLNHVTSYAYDLDGDLTSVTDANGHVTTYAYDILKRKTARTLPLGQTETFGYDPVGNTVSHVDFAGKTTSMSYDARDRLLGRFPDPTLGEPAETFTYNATGTRASMSDASGMTTYTYDSRNRMLTKAAPAGTLTYTYDASGNVASMQSSNVNGTSVNYAWDAANQLVSVTDNRIAGGMTTTAYAVTGRPSQIVQPSGVTATYGYDNMNRLTSLVWSKGAPFASWTSTYSSRGQRLTSTELSGRQVAYGYDDVTRLSGETITNDPSGANGVIQYTLDPVGNRLAQTSSVAAIAPTRYSYDGNDQLTSDGHDTNGNTTSSDGATYGYDFRNRLKSKNGGAVTLTYDGDGARVAKTAVGVTTLFLVDELNPTGYSQVLEELSGTNEVQVRYTYGTMLVSQVRDPQNAPVTDFYGTDIHGDVRFLTGTEGERLGSYDYTSWGQVLTSTGVTPNNRQYGSQEWDADISFLNLRARLYDARLGRFVTADPYVYGDLRTTHHSYLYSHSDPINYSDPSGLTEFLEWTGIRNATSRATVFVYRFVETGTARFYFGISVDPLRRLGQHINEMGKRGIEVSEESFEILYGFTAETQALAREAARAVETHLIITAQGEGQDLINRANSMSLENLSYYLDFIGSVVK